MKVQSCRLWNFYEKSDLSISQSVKSFKVGQSLESVEIRVLLLASVDEKRQWLMW